MDKLNVAATGATIEAGYAVRYAGDDARHVVAMSLAADREELGCSAAQGSGRLGISAHIKRLQLLTLVFQLLSM